MNLKQVIFPPFKSFPPIKFIYLIGVLFLCFSSSCVWSYEVIFEGIDDAEKLKIIQSASQLEKLKNSSPATTLGLKRRAEGDKQNIIQALQSQAYYDAKVDFTISADQSQVTIKIEPGPVYPLSVFKIRYFQNEKEVSEKEIAKEITLKDLSIKLDQPALPETILMAEDTLLDKLNLQGYAFATIQKRDVFVDQETKTVIVLLVVDLGPLTYFGPVTIKGIERLNENFFYKKLRWEEGELYNPNYVEKTQEALDLTGLFRSVSITHAEQPTADNLLPLEISVLEGKQRSIGFGINYNTSLGPGITGEWEDRNILHEGQKLSFRSDIWVKLQQGILTYVIPDFKRQDQNLVWLLDYKHDRIKSFTEHSSSLSATIERKLTDQIRISYGGMYKRLLTERSALNGTFNLLQIPLQFRWSSTDSILEPTKGATFQFKTVPSLQIFRPRFAYCSNFMTGTLYQALTKDKRHIFAVKLMLGTIFGASKHEIPPPERFYAGSESTIRGYRYLTLGHLKGHDPIGGRSLLVYSIEFRARIRENYGLVCFYDLGNVFTDTIPNFKEGIRQSIGVGLRYYTPIGPIRLDVAFPVNKRHIDNSLEAYFSIGQAF